MVVGCSINSSKGKATSRTIPISVFWFEYELYWGCYKFTRGWKKIYKIFTNSQML